MRLLAVDVLSLSDLPKLPTNWVPSVITFLSSVLSSTGEAQITTYFLAIAG